jgi:hypothetical protein
MGRVGTLEISFSVAGFGRLEKIAQKWGSLRCQMDGAGFLSVELEV